RSLGMTPLLDHLPALHHEHHFVDRRDVFQRIAVDGDDVGVVFRLERADVLRPHGAQCWRLVRPLTGVIPSERSESRDPLILAKDVALPISLARDDTLT